MQKLILALLIGTVLVQCKQDKAASPAHHQSTSSERTTIHTASALYDNFGIEIGKYKVRDLKVHKNESLYILLKKLGFTSKQIYSTTQKAKKRIDIYAFRPGQPYRAYFSKDTNQLEKMVWEPDNLRFVTFNWNVDSLQISRATRIERLKTKSIHGTIHSSLYNAISDANARNKLVYELTNILAWQIDFTTLRKGDSFRILYNNKFVDGDYYDVGKVLAIELKHRGDTFLAYYFNEGKFDGYYDEKGHSVEKALLKIPFKYDQRISSHFNPHRMNPVLHRRMPHKGVDYAAPYGTPVLATGKGVVLEAHYGGAAGNIVKIRHNSTFTTAYMHLSKFASGIHHGVHVNQGQVIGYVGATGRVTGTNLHYGVFKNGKAVNPLTLHLPPAKSLPQKYMPAFKKVRGRLNKELFEETPHPTDSLSADVH
jgi:murein DD-endopeptidase MepM/ murein hydrolase activator NlpD